MIIELDIPTTKTIAAIVYRWKPYPNYKDSGVEWLGELPEGWGVKRLKYISTINDETLSETTDSDFELLYVDINSVDSVSGIKNKEYLTFENAPSRARRKVHHGDIIISTVRTYLRAISPINNPEPNMIVSTGFAVIHPKKGIESQFAAYALRAPYFVDEVVANSVGVSYPAINASKLITINIILPSLIEQRAIASFLDRKTAHLDTLISKKERLISLLQEKRAALISHTVTKGLDPDVPMKDSGMEWLGEIPAHWETKRLKFIALEPLKYGANESAELNNPNLPRFIRITDIDESGFLREDTFRSLPEDIAEPFLLKTGDMLFARSGATVGKSFMYNESWGRACYAGYLIRLRINSQVAIPYFISYFATSSVYWNWLSSIFIKATIQNVSAEKYANLSIAMPLLAEQHAIVSFLDHETACIDALISKVREGIEKLREYRTALISATVIGKIDVRNENRN